MEGGVWPVVVALVLSAVVGTAIGWWWTGRGRAPVAEGGSGTELPASLPPGEVDQRQQLLSRLEALQVDRRWFQALVDAALAGLHGVAWAGGSTQSVPSLPLES